MEQQSRIVVNVCEYIQDMLSQLGFDVTDEDSHEDIRQALDQVHFVLDNAPVSIQAVTVPPIGHIQLNVPGGYHICDLLVQKREDRYHTVIRLPSCADKSAAFTQAKALLTRHLTAVSTVTLDTARSALAVAGIDPAMHMVTAVAHLRELFNLSLTEAKRLVDDLRGAAIPATHASRHNLMSDFREGQRVRVIRGSVGCPSTGMVGIVASIRRDNNVDSIQVDFGANPDFRHRWTYFMPPNVNACNFWESQDNLEIIP